jgi:hypothetical protein
MCYIALNDGTIIVTDEMEKSNERNARIPLEDITLSQDVLGKIVKSLSNGRWYPGRYLNLGPNEYELNGLMSYRPQNEMVHFIFYIFI